MTTWLRLVPLAIVVVACAAATASPTPPRRPDAPNAPEPTPTPEVGEWAPNVLAGWELHQLDLVVSDESERGHIDRPAAVASLGEHYGLVYDVDVDVDAFLVRATSDSSFVDGERMVDRPVWIVRLTGAGIHIPSGAPSSAPGMSRAPGHIAKAIYGFIDADTGAFLFSTLFGGLA